VPGLREHALLTGGASVPGAIALDAARAVSGSSLLRRTTGAVGSTGGGGAGGAVGGRGMAAVVVGDGSSVSAIGKPTSKGSLRAGMAPSARPSIRFGRFHSISRLLDEIRQLEAERLREQGQRVRVPRHEGDASGRQRGELIRQALRIHGIALDDAHAAVLGEGATVCRVRFHGLAKTCVTFSGRSAAAPASIRDAHFHPVLRAHGHPSAEPRAPACEPLTGGSLRAPVSSFVMPKALLVLLMAGGAAPAAAVSVLTRAVSLP